MIKFWKSIIMTLIALKTTAIQAASYDPPFIEIRNSVTQEDATAASPNPPPLSTPLPTRKPVNPRPNKLPTYEEYMNQPGAKTTSELLKECKKLNFIPPAISPKCNAALDLHKKGMDPELKGHEKLVCDIEVTNHLYADIDWDCIMPYTVISDD
jgi:hypothetical protein